MMTYHDRQFADLMVELGHEDKIKKIFGDDTLLQYDLNSVFSYKTPREDSICKKFSVAPLWYLNFLIEQQPTTIVDIGCGKNLFKPVLKKLFNVDVHGIDPTSGNLAADEFDFFDSDFSIGHANMYQSAFSINALHFIPLDQLTQRIKEFHNVIMPGGHGFLALNAMRMIEKTDSRWLVNKFNSDTPTQAQVHTYVCDELSSLNINFLVMDVLIDQIVDEYMDGNIRLVFKK